MKKISNARLEKLSNVLKAAAHPIRLGVIDLLDKKGALSVNEICEELGCDQSLTSHHLKNMRLNGLLSSKRDGQQILYSLLLTEVVEVVRCLNKCDKF